MFLWLCQTAPSVVANTSALIATATKAHRIELRFGNFRSAKPERAEFTLDAPKAKPVMPQRGSSELLVPCESQLVS
jgi:hypothetical protein